MAVNVLKSVQAEKQLKSKVGLKVVDAIEWAGSFVFFLSCVKGRRSKVAPTKLTQARLSDESLKYNKRVAPQPHTAFATRHTQPLSTRVVHSAREWATSQHTQGQQPSHPSISGSQVHLVGHKAGAVNSPVHVALPLGRPRIMPSSAIFPSPPPKATSTETLSQPLPLPSRPPRRTPLSRLQVRV